MEYQPEPKVHISATPPLSYQWQDVVSLFNQQFLVSHNTELVKGDEEPVYLPADEQHPHHRIIFAHGFFASALHEISHWCIAGPQRLLLEDFGYWYQPDGRSAEEQAVFERVEVKPQALEWIFSKACGVRFRVSTDNLSGEQTDNQAFKENVYQQVQVYLADGISSLSDRPRLFVKRLADFYGLPIPSGVDFNLSELD